MAASLLPCQGDGFDSMDGYLRSEQHLWNGMVDGEISKGVNVCVVQALDPDYQLGAV